jgi:tRNA-specific 2-thiouridylase
MNKEIQVNRRVLLGMSGGTDSSVAAMLLLDAGYEVEGVTYRFYEKDQDISYIEEAKRLALRLGIRHHVIDVRDEFEQTIIRYFIKEYMAGRTPVPCMKCNNLMKWRLLLNLANERGIYHIATGHYVRKERYRDRLYLLPGLDDDKDQSFFLWGMQDEEKERVLFPLGAFTKEKARALAREKGFQRVGDKKDSLGVCFCPMDYRSFLRERLGDEVFQKGVFVDEKGGVLGHHPGFPFFTIGQRRGLGIHLNRAVYVKETIPATNRVVLAPLKALECKGMLLKEWVLVNLDDLVSEEPIIVRIRYRKQEDRCRVVKTENGLLHVFFETPITAVAPGQSAAFYQSGRLIGGGIIAMAFPC